METTEHPRRVLIHVAGVVATVLAAVTAVYLSVAVAWSHSSCDDEVAREVVELRVALVVLTAAVTVVPLAVAWWARRCGTAHRPWLGVALVLAAVGGWAAFTSDPYQWCLF